MSALHAASVVSSGDSIDEQAGMADLQPLVAEADVLAQVAGLPSRFFWDMACAVSLNAESADELGTIVYRKLLGAESRITPERVAHELRPILRWGRTEFPDLVNTLKTRQSPLKIQWEARGMGLLHFIAKLTNRAVIPGSATIALVQPIAGGRGVAHLDFNSIRFEAMLANPTPELPEVVRMAWLISQLEIDVPMNSESLNKNRLPWLGSLALLPATLCAAEFVELVHVDRSVLVAAIEKWILPLFPDKQVSGDSLAEAVWNWWTTYQASRPPWPVALAALDRMLPV